jgi:predicted HTH transcriptional regulator
LSRLIGYANLLRVESNEGHKMTLSDADILARLTAIEDGTTERKPYADSRGWVKTVVAFSNSLAIDQPGILFVGVNNNGTIQDQPTNFEDKQKIVTGELSNIYPPVNPTILVREKDGKKFDLPQRSNMVTSPNSRIEI